MTSTLPSDLTTLAVDVAGHIATVTLTGTGHGNAMGSAFWHELPLVFNALDADEDVRAVVLTGAGRNFSVGLDLNDLLASWGEHVRPDAGATARAELLADIRGKQAAITSVATCRKPVIAAVSGWCVGGGVDLIAAADVRLAGRDAKFSVREVKVAIVADLGSLQRLEGIIEQGRLRELALTGKDIAADEAERIGLVNSAHDAVLDAARAMAEEIAANPPAAVYGTKRTLTAEREARIASELREVATWNAAFLPSDDLLEAITAFSEKRKPHYRGH
ncbi:crotonase/enoyl-CoA hydratase family protein [Spelaeicoccus albus]|uniref:Enoyl-CoA hydratase n=1 Tax=Spelaeicoccus albus TaxID=1280376 RepID=A0A7Z0D4U5_9MICO|nr:crotonase/enoyl-CoA hydratase family protein [Spelaeicoccus albus]NYI68889.1 enoyl-CoA hydratase [Spelaeicoccus albus]